MLEGSNTSEPNSPSNFREDKKLPQLDKATIELYAKMIHDREKADIEQGITQEEFSVVTFQNRRTPTGQQAHEKSQESP